MLRCHVKRIAPEIVEALSSRRDAHPELQKSTSLRTVNSTRRAYNSSTHLINRQTDLWLEKELKPIQNCC
jgi:hypothetical protein